MTKPKGLTVKEAAEHTGYHPEHIRRLIRQKEIKAELVGLMYWIEEESLNDYLQEANSNEDGRFGPRR